MLAMNAFTVNYYMINMGDKFPPCEMRYYNISKMETELATVLYNTVKLKDYMHTRAHSTSHNV